MWRSLAILFALGVACLGCVVSAALVLSTESSVGKAASAVQASQLYNAATVWLLGWILVFLGLIAAALIVPRK
jgi:cell division protein FtsX